MSDDSNKQPGHEEASIAMENPFLYIETRELLLWYILFGLPFGLVFSIAEAIWQISEFTRDNIVQIIWLLLPLYWIYRKSKQINIDIRLYFRRNLNTKWLHLIGLVLCLIVFSFASLSLIRDFLSYVWPSLLEVDGWSYNPKQSVLNNSIYILLIIIIAPISEELLFRGILLSRWSVKWGMRKAVLLSALAFSILHADMFGSFLFALCMAILYLRTQTLLVTIAAHALYNTIVAAIMIGVEHQADASASYTIKHLISIAWVKGACFAMTLPIIVLYIYRNWPKKDALSPYVLQMKEEYVFSGSQR